jgi:hypothetical protein
MTAVVQTTCPGCKVTLRFPADCGGRAVRCSRCRLVLRVESRPASRKPTLPPPARAAWQGPVLALCVLALAGAAAAAGWSRIGPVLLSKAAPAAAAAEEPEAPPARPEATRGDGSGPSTAPSPEPWREAPSAGGEPAFVRDVRPLVDKYCVRCHKGPRPKGGVALDRDKDEAAVLKNRRTWEKVADNLRSGDMPPPGARRPSAGELDRINAWLDAVVLKADCSGFQGPGRVTLRRLNRAEYNNTLRDLLGIQFQPAKDFPADDVGYGFDNIGDVLSLPPILLEKYLAAAEQAIEKAMQSPEGRRLIFVRPVKERGAFRQNLRHFATRAYRRPVAEDELKRLLKLTQTLVNNGATPEDAGKATFQAVLVSPHFLFRVEADPPPGSPHGVAPVSDWELASRLSYFLWSSMPDEELFRHCRDKALRKPGVLESQVQRMLKAPKAQALADNFASQWLQTRNLASFQPDPKRFPTFDNPLRQAMLKETELFFLHVVQEDRSVLELIDADYTFLNERLARHYGIKGVTGELFRKVSLAGTPQRAMRGGVLTQASVLAVTSNPTRTSPVKRGKFILDNILGTPPPPPPPDVEELPEGAELKGTLRQRMEQHRTNPSCASCHQRMDPLGFGFENFDAIGAWRTRDGGSAIDPSGVLPGGQAFKGPAELRAILKGKQDLFARCLAEKLLTYALGRGVERGDRCFVDEIARNLGKGHYRFSTLVTQIVRSDPFQKRQGKGGKK